MKNKEYALALSGGGTRGAYEIGVYKALKEMNINIKAITGTSIGALNGAMLLSSDLKKVEEMYKKIDICNVIDIDKSNINTDKDIFDIHNIFKVIKDYTKKKGLDNKPLEKVLKKEIDIDKIYKTDIDFGLVTYSIKSKKAVEIFKEDIPKNEFVDFLLASSCFPIYKAQKIEEEEYLDGFFYDNLPINTLIKKGYKNIIAVDIGSLNSSKKLIDKKVYVKFIKASQNLGGFFEFDREKIKFNINLGYLDTMKSFNKLKGHMYFFKPYEFNRLLHKFTLEELYGLEYAAQIYEIDKYNIYTSKEFLNELLKRHRKATKNYNNLRNKLDLKKMLNGGKGIKKIINKGLGLCLVIDMINNKPAFRNIKVINKLFSTYFKAADSLIELENMYDSDI